MAEQAPHPQGWADLVDGGLLNPINIREDGTEVVDPDYVWTNTKTDGSADDMNDCNNWTSSMLLELGSHGVVGAEDLQWTDAGEFSCKTTFRLYCFED